MQKQLIREIKSHYGYRWNLLKHNRRQSNHKLITLHDKVIINSITSGPTLIMDVIGLQYQDLISSLSIHNDAVKEKYKNILLINNIVFKYKTLDSIANYVLGITDQFLDKSGVVIVGFNYQFIKFNRLKYNFSDALGYWLTKLTQKGFTLRWQYTKISKTTPYGDCFFIFDVILQKQEL